MFHLNGDHATLHIGDFDGNGYVDLYSPTVNYHGSGRFDDYLPDFYKGHAVHPNQIVFRFEDGFKVDTLESTDPHITDEEILMTGFNQIVYDMNRDGKDDIFEILGDHGLVYNWDIEKKEMWPVDTLYSGSEEVLYVLPKIFDIDGDGFEDLVYIFQNNIVSTRGIVINTGQKAGVQLADNPISITLSDDLMDYDVIGFESIELDGRDGRELILYYGKQIDSDNRPDSEIRAYDLDFRTNSSINVTEKYFFDGSNLDWTSIGNGFLVTDLNSDGYEDLYFPNSHCYRGDDVEHCSDIAMFNGTHFLFANNRTYRASEHFPIDIDGDGVQEVINLHNQTIGKLQINSSILVSTKSSETPPTTHSLNQNSPNPFNPTTIISYSLLKSGMVTIKIYDITGRFITTLVNGVKRAGAHTAQFEGSTLSSGIYVYTLESNGYRQSRQMILMK